jgi:hypothetical protein
MIALLGFGLALAATLFAQRARLVLVVNGKNTGASIVQLDGHSYVDIETLAQITHGSLKLEPNRIVLTVPEPASSTASVQAAPGLSRDFASVAILALGYMKEWRTNLETMVTYGLAVNPGWAQAYQDRANTSLQEAAAIVSSNAERNALQLLNLQYSSIARWANALAADRRDLNGARTVDPDSLRNDPALAKISECDKFLHTMLIRGNTPDIPGSCR